MNSTGTVPPPTRSVSDILEDARTAERRGLWEVARQEYEDALSRLNQGPDGPLAASLLRWIGRTYLNTGKLSEAGDCFEGALAVAELVGDLSSQAHAVNCIAITCQRRGRLDEAEDLYHSARALARTGEDKKLLAMIEQNLGTVDYIRGDLDLALRHYQSALRGFRELGLRERLGPLLNNQAMLQTKMGRFYEAERLYAEGFETSVLERDVDTQVAIQVNRVTLWIAQKDLPRAREACDAAYGLAQRLKTPRWLGEIRKHFGVIARESGDHEAAVNELHEAEGLARDLEDSLLTAEVLRELAEVFWRTGQQRDTLACLNRAFDLFSELRARRDLADLEGRLDRLEEVFQEIVYRWGESIESMDRYTHGHCNRVAEYGCALAEATGIEEGELVWFRMGAFLHDVGKVAVPPEILNKPGPLTDAERREMEGHAEEGESMLAEIEFPWDIRPMVRHHHEHWAGTGYPDGLAGPAIPLAARILCIADVFDALTTERSYRPAMPIYRVMEIMEEEAGRVFDPQLFATFKDLLRDGRIGGEWFGSLPRAGLHRESEEFARSPRPRWPSQSKGPVPLHQDWFGVGDPARTPNRH
jgi:putative nucleotidyltransferase with HDIG domain